MQFGPEKVLACPACGSAIRIWSLRSGNTCGAVLWSDGKLQTPMLFHPPKVTRCASCLSFFWVDKAREATVKVPRWKFWKKPKPVRVLGAGEFLEALESGAAALPEEERFLRIRAWHGWNDRFRNPSEAASWHLDASNTANLQALSALLDEADPYHLLMNAEIARELGNFAEVETLLSKPSPPKFSEIVEQMRTWGTAGQRRVLPFRDNRPSEEEREAVFKQQAAKS